MSKHPPPAPTASAIGPCPTMMQISRTPRPWKFSQHLRTTRPPPYIKRERERERECVCACVLFYNTKDWMQFYISGLTWEQGWIRSVCTSAQYDHTSFFAYHLKWVYIPKTHTGLQKIQINTQQLHVTGYNNAETSLHKAIPFSI